MKKFIYPILGIALSGFCAFADELKVAGVVTEENGTPVPAASCVAFSANDSTYIAGAVTDTQGKFDLISPTENAYITISSVGFANKTIDLTQYKNEGRDERDTIDLGNITLAASNTELAEVVVKAVKPQLTMEKGNLVYNVDDLLKNNSYTSAHALLLDLPLLFTADGKQIELSGAPVGSVIYINGRKSNMDSQQLIAYLQTIPANKILSVEIVYVPGPEWQTSSSVINVRLRKEKGYYASGRVSGEYSRTDNNKFYLNGSAVASVPKWSAYVSYSFRDTKSAVVNNEFGTHTVDGVPHDYNIDYESKTKNQSNYVYSSITYDPNDSHHLELVYNGSFSPDYKRESIIKSNLFDADAGLYSSSSRYNGVYLAYAYKQKINANVSWGNNISDLTTGYSNGTDANLLNNSTSRQRSNSLNSYIVFTLPLGRDWTLETGATAYFTFAKTSQYISGVVNDENPDLNFSDLKQDEVTTQTFIGFRKSFFNNRFHIYPTFNLSYFKTNSFHYLTTTPYFSCSLNPANNHFFQFVFRVNKGTPSLSSMLNTIRFTDPYRITVGNPDLRSCSQYIEQLIYVFKNKYVLNFTGVQQRHPDISIPYQMADRMLQVTQPYNFGHVDNYSLSLTVPLTFGFYNCNLNLSGGFTDQYISDWHGMEIDRLSFYGSLNIRNRFTILKQPRLTGYLNGKYYTRSNGWGYQTDSPCGDVSAGLSVSLLSDQLDISAFVYNIFNQGYSKDVWIHHALQDINWYKKYTSRNIDITISYTIKGYRDRNKHNLQDSRIGM